MTTKTTRLAKGGAAGLLAVSLAVGLPTANAWATYDSSNHSRADDRRDNNAHDDRRDEDKRDNQGNNKNDRYDKDKGRDDRGGAYDVRSVDQLRDAVARANARPGADRITLRANIRFAPGTGGNDNDGPERGDLDVTGDLRVDGHGYTIDGRGIDRIFDVTAGTTVTLKQVTLKGGAPAAGASGGAVRSAGTLTVKGSTLRNNSVQGPGASGGAVFNSGGTLRVDGSTLRGNSATRAGGAIEANAGKTTVNRSTLTANRTGDGPGNGGGLHLTGAGDVRVDGSRVTNNTATAEGGGLWNSAVGTMVVTRTSLTGNTAAGNDADQGGGGLFNDGGSLRVEGSYIAANTATGTSGSGGGILNNGGALTVTKSTLRNNSAQRAGGGIETNGGTVDLTRVDLLNNRAGANPGNGGGLHVTADATVNYDRGTVRGNRADNEGGGLWNSAAGTIIAKGVSVRGNSAPVGPNVFNDPPGGTFVLNGQAVPAGDNQISTDDRRSGYRR